MPPIKGKGEVVQARSPAEFFAENQNIAGFDNVSTRKFAIHRLLFANETLPRSCSQGNLYSRHFVNLWKIHWM